jgi:hypothetical protein
MSLIRFGANPEDAGRALVLAAGLLQGPLNADNRERPLRVARGLCGVGLFADKGGIWPSIFVDAPKMQGKLAALEPSEYPRINDILGQVFFYGREWLTKNLKIVPVASCKIQANSADAITCVGIRGRFGVPVNWSGSRGYMTAGHVGQQVGNTVYDASKAGIGAVVFASDPQPNQYATADFDIALVECDPNAVINNLRIGNFATAAANESVLVHAGNPPLPTDILAYCKWFAATQSAVTFADVYLSSNAVTVDGDSGAPVTLRKSGEVIGHVVAGGANTSCFQDIKPQLARLRSDSKFASLAI